MLYKVTIKLPAYRNEEKWFNKESNWFLRVYHYNKSLYTLCCEQTVIILDKKIKRKCGISNVDANRQVARLGRECLKQILLCSYLYPSYPTPPPPCPWTKVKGQNNQSHFNSSVQNCQLTNNIKKIKKQVKLCYLWSCSSGLVQ